jgi:hypothetical protein
LLRHKLRRVGWRDPQVYQTSPGLDFMAELASSQAHRVFSMAWPRFAEFVDGRLQMEAPTRPFGLMEVGLF